MPRLHPTTLIVATVAATLGLCAFLGGNWASQKCYIDADGHRVCPRAAAQQVRVSQHAPEAHTKRVAETLVEVKKADNQPVKLAETLVNIEHAKKTIKAPPRRTTCESKRNCESSESCHTSGGRFLRFRRR